MPTIFNTGVGALIPENIGGFYVRTLAVSCMMAILCKILLDIYLKTKSGLLLRATGNNEQYVTMLAKDPGVSKVIGLSLGNGFAALAGSVIAQSKGSADQRGNGSIGIGFGYCRVKHFPQSIPDEGNYHGIVGQHCL